MLRARKIDPAANELTLRSDNGLVFGAKPFVKVVRRYGLDQEYITPYTPEQNGMNERFFGTLKSECVWQHRFQDRDQAFVELVAPQPAVPASETRSTAAAIEVVLPIGCRVPVASGFRAQHARRAARRARGAAMIPSHVRIFVCARSRSTCGGRVTGSRSRREAARQGPARDGLFRQAAR